MAGDTTGAEIGVVLAEPYLQDPGDRSMSRTSFTRLLLPLIALASCARATSNVAVQPDSGGVPRQGAVQLGEGVSVPVGPTLRELPKNQRYRFVSPDSIALGVTPEDIASANEPRVAVLRDRFSTVFRNSQWTASTDSAQYDVTIFTTTRSKTRHLPREPLVTDQRTEPPNCDLPPAPEPLPCVKNPIIVTRYEAAAIHTVTIIRRRADGATRVWREPGVPKSKRWWAVEKSLKRMLRT